MVFESRELLRAVSAEVASHSDGDVIYSETREAVLGDMFNSSLNFRLSNFSISNGCPDTIGHRRDDSLFGNFLAASLFLELVDKFPGKLG